MYNKITMENWDKKIHVKSSLERKSGQYAMFIGRWQPLHEGHKAMFFQAIMENKNVLICVRDGEVNEKNPFTAEEVKKNIEEHYSQYLNSGLIKVMIVPDICSVEFGRGVGYDIIERIPPSEVAEISATKIRAEMKNKGEL